MSGRKLGIALTLGLAVFGASEKGAHAQTMPPLTAAQILPPQDYSTGQTWGAISGVAAIAGIATVALMPRVFYSDPEVTVGWKARWHVSQLAPVLALTTLTLVNEFALKPLAASTRPNCPDPNPNAFFGAGTAVSDPGNPFGACNTYGGPSSHAFLAFSALGQGAGVFLFDTTKWSDGNINAGALFGDVGLPLLFAGITAAGRLAGDWESPAQVLEGGLGGLAIGFLTGMTYALMQRPECGYTGSMICW